MSYCVNCGVELADSEKYCRLCNVEVINPKAPWEEPPVRPYPHHLENLMKKVDRRYFATLVALFLLIPVFVTILIDLFSSNGMTWSAYTASAMALIYVIIVFPLYFKKFNPVIFLSVDTVALLVCLLFIERISRGSWFFTVAMPITLAAGVFIISSVVLFRKKTVSFLLKTAFVFAVTSIFITLIELVVSIHKHNTVIMKWSFYVFIPCVVLAAASMILEQRKNLKEEIKRRMFY